jgi:hypothetical protein
MFSLISLLLGGVSSFFTGLFNKETTQIKADADVTIAETKGSTQIIHDTADDIGVKLCRDLIMWPVATLTALLTWDNIILHSHPTWVIVVESFEKNPGFEYLPYAVITFLFGNIGINMWSRMRR